MVDSAVLKRRPGRGPDGEWFTGRHHFSGSLPATRLAVLDMDPFLTFLRASIAGLSPSRCWQAFARNGRARRSLCRWPSSRQGW
jgi:hypothetical protein